MGIRWGVFITSLPTAVRCSSTSQIHNSEDYVEGHDSRALETSREVFHGLSEGKVVHYEYYQKGTLI